MAVILHHRTRKAVEAAKVTPRYVVTKIIEGAIKRGELPPCPDGDEGKWDFKGVPGFMIHQAGYCLMEMQTLCCKLLQCPTGSCFITSDNPVVILNQFCIGVDPHRNFTGFAKSGFQLLLPISPNLCLFFYDTKIYKVGSRQSELVEISKQDVEIINSLEIQSADKCLYFHDLKLEQEVWQLVSRYAHLRVCIQNGLRVIPIGDNKQFLHSRAPSVKLPRVWSFCRGRKHVKYQPGDLRKPEWTALGKEFMDDVERNPTGEDIFTRLKKFHKKIVDDFDQSQKTSAV